MPCSASLVPITTVCLGDAPRLPAHPKALQWEWIGGGMGAGGTMHPPRSVWAWEAGAGRCHAAQRRVWALTDTPTPPTAGVGTHGPADATALGPAPSVLLGGSPGVRTARWSRPPSRAA